MCVYELARLFSKNPCAFGEINGSKDLLCVCLLKFNQRVIGQGAKIGALVAGRTHASWSKYKTLGIKKPLQHFYIIVLGAGP